MRKFTYLLKTLLISALFMGTNSAWGDTKTINTKSGTPNGSLHFDENAIAISHSAGGNVYVPNNADILGGRFAFCKTSNNHNWTLDNDYGLYWMYKSDANRPFSVLNLSSGDVVTFTHSTDEKVTITLSSANATRSHVENNATTSFTMTSAGNLDLLFTHTGNREPITQITITSSTDVLTAPSAKATAVDGIKRTVTITPGTSTNGGAIITTYYNIGGSSPATSTDTEYIEPFEISATSTINMLSVSSIGGSSWSSMVVEAGTTVQLAAPTATITGFVSNKGVYNPTYTFTSDNSSLVGSPTATFKLTSEDGETVTSHTATSAFRVYAVADGYEAAYTDVSLYEFYKTKHIDFSEFSATDLVALGCTKDETWGYNINGKTYNYGGMVFEGGYNFYLLNNDKYILGRNGSSKCKITVNDLQTDEYAVLVKTDGTDENSKLINGSNTKVINVGQETFSAINYYAPSSSTVSVTVSDADYATYVNSSYSLNFSSSTIKAYKVKVSSKGEATLTKVDNVPAGTPVLLYKDGGATENIPVMAVPAAVTENDLVAGTGAEVATTVGDYTNMILNNGASGVGFYFANGQTVAANRAYLHIATDMAPDVEPGAKALRVVVNGEATEVVAPEVAETEEPEVLYNMAGIQVDKNFKGFVINQKGVKRFNK